MQHKLYSHVKGPMVGFGKWSRDSKFESSLSLHGGLKLR